MIQIPELVWRFCRESRHCISHLSVSARVLSIAVRRWRVAIRYAGLTLVLTAGCSASTPLLSPQRWPHANVLLVSIDTLRQDRVGAYGNLSNLTPTIDGLAASGVRFTHAFAHAPMTLPSHTAILTGLTPRRSGVRNNTGFRLGDGIPTLATFLKRAGYRTGAFVGAVVLDAQFGLARDFDVYDDRLSKGDGPSFQVAQRRASEVLTAGADWLQQPAAQPYFAWVHLFDPHAPYDAPPPFRQGRTPYDAEVAYTDAMLGDFFNRLRSARLLDNTIVVLTADHGESLGDHGETTHGLFAYQSTLAVPLVIAAPGMRPGTDATPVGHVDILPTVLDLVGVAPPPCDGISLAQRDRPDRAIYFEALDASLTRGWAPLTGVVEHGWKYIDLPQPELYELNTDPGETNNRIADASRRAMLQAAQVALTRVEAARPVDAAGQPVDGETAARLRSLGYVAGRNDRTQTPSFADDPKQLVTLNERFNDALTAFDEGHGASALSGFLSVLQQRADFLTARTSAATVLISQGRGREAVALLDAAPPGQRQSPELQIKLGAARQAAGDLTGAVQTLESIKRSGARTVDVDQDLAIAYAAQGRVDEARNLFQEIVARDRAPATAWYNLGLVELRARHQTEASAAFSRAVERDPANGHAWQALGATLISRDRARAILAWQRAEKLLPADYDLLFNLGVVLADAGDAAAARPYLERFVREAPRPKYARDIDHVQGRLRALARVTGR